MIHSARDLLSVGRTIVAFSGAGLSAESGVATFRDAATGGLWTQYDPTQLSSQEGFADDPDLVIRWFADRRRSISAAQPNPAHRALASRPDIVNITQNIDNLLHRAGVEDVIQLHGSIAADRCNAGPRCAYEELVDLSNPPGMRACPRCGDHLRPSVVWFGEALPMDAWERASQLCSECEVMLVIGTSAAVLPAASLIELARDSGAQTIIINTQHSLASHLADIELIGPAGEILPQLLA